MVSFNFKWKGSEIRKRLRSSLSKNVRAAGNVVLVEAKAELNVSGGYARISKAKRKTDGNNDRYSRVGSTPSKPGEAPHYRTKNIRRGMFNKLINKGATARVGTTAPEGPLQEFGTRSQAPRPYLRSSLQRKQSVVAAALTNPVNL